VFAELTRRELGAYSTYTEGRTGATFEEYFPDEGERAAGDHDYFAVARAAQMVAGADGIRGG